jgi:hypothetical protein
MISTQSGVWLRPAILGGYGGMSDRFFFFVLSSVRFALLEGEAVGEGFA